MGHEDASEGGGDHGGGACAPEEGQKGFGQLRSQARREGRVHEKPRALEVKSRVESGRKEKVPLEDGSALLEKRQQVVAHEVGLYRGRGARASRASRYTSAVTPLSAVFITQNEEMNLGAALESVRFCDEMLVIDSGSTDRTREIAQEKGARVIVNAPWPGFKAQRAFATRSARNDWILMVDADERVTPALAGEIRALQARGFLHAGYRFPRVARYLDRWIRATDWYPDLQLRLFDRTRGAWEGALVHESYKVQGTIGRLKGELEHHPYTDISHHMRKMDVYTTLWAHQSYDAGKRAGLPMMLGATAWALFRNYVLKGGFLLGEVGITVSILNTHYTFVKLAKLRERASIEK
jgi:hypothetical protein